jgi:hypothetical protein
MDRTPAPGSGSNPRPAILNPDDELDGMHDKAKAIAERLSITSNTVRYLGSSPDTLAMVEGVNEQNRLLAVIANIMKDALALARE